MPFHRLITIEFPGVFTTDGSVLFCQACDTDVRATQRSQVKQHVDAAKHILNVARKNKSETRSSQALLTTLAESTESGRSASKFTMDLA